MIQKLMKLSKTRLETNLSVLGFYKHEEIKII